MYLRADIQKNTWLKNVYDNTLNCIRAVYMRPLQFSINTHHRNSAEKSTEAMAERQFTVKGYNISSY